jgi:hypothetical protein
VGVLNYDIPHPTLTKIYNEALIYGIKWLPCIPWVNRYVNYSKKINGNRMNLTLNEDTFYTNMYRFVCQLMNRDIYLKQHFEEFTNISTK